MLRQLADFVWPTIEPLDPADAAVEHHSLVDDLETIKGCTWVSEAAQALEEARRLADGEVERRRNIEGKASTYLLVTAALVPLLTYLEGAVWERKAGTAPVLGSMPVLLFAVACLVNAGRWAFKTLEVSASFAIDATDLAAASGGPDALGRVARLNMTVARRNRAGINSKATFLMMSHRFLLRSFVGFGLLLAIEAVWEVSTALSKAGMAMPGAF